MLLICLIQAFKDHEMRHSNLITWFIVYIEDVYTPSIENMFTMETQPKFDQSVKIITQQQMIMLKSIDL